MANSPRIYDMEKAVVTTCRVVGMYALHVTRRMK